MTRDRADAAPGDRSVWQLPIVRVTAIVGILALVAAVAAGVWATSWAQEPPRSVGGVDVSPDVEEPPSPRPTPGAPTPTPDDPEAPPPAPPDIPPPVDGSTPAPPVVGAPADGISTNDATPTFSGTGRPGSEVHVQLVNPANGMASTVAAAQVAPDGTWVATTGAALPDGRHAVLVMQVAANGKVSESVRRIIVIDTVILAPVIDPLPTGPQRLLPTVTGAGEPGAIVTLRDGAGATIDAAVVDAGGRWSLTLPDPGRDGMRLTATQADAAGNISAASPATAPIAFARPTLSVDTSPPSDAGATVVDFSVTGAAGATVEVAVDGATTGSPIALGGGTASGSTPALPDGTHTIAVRYREGGRVGSWSIVTVTISAAPSGSPSPAPTPTPTPTPAPTPSATPSPGEPSDEPGGSAP